MVRVFGDDHRRDQRLGRNAGLDQMFGRRSLRHLAIAVAAGVFGPARDDDLEARRDHVEPFRDVLAELDPKPVAARAALVGEIDDDLLARQMFGQRAAIDLALAPDGRPGWSALAFPSASASPAATACSTSSSMSASWSGSIFSDRGPKPYRSEPR